MRMRWLLILLCACNLRAIEPLVLHSRATDATGTLAISELQQLENQLAAFESKTSNQIVVVLIPSLEGEEIRDYAIRLAEKSKVGQVKKDNGVILVIAKADKKMTIEVGYGLEGVLPDATCDTIIRNIIRPKFRQGDFYGGILAGVQAIMAATQGEFAAPAKDRPRVLPLAFLLFVLIALFMLFLFGGNFYNVSSRGYRRGHWGSGWGGGGWSGGSGWGSGGGGWSGGGGSFGGGGSSGSW
ncbi:MAG: TPM domain-containing protein [Deltaproteobacteria bacterium]|nr:TPM domain-containing protein [Deltaproteobacteria bacterium]